MRQLSMLALSLALFTSPALAAAPCVDACKVLLDEGRVLSSQGHAREAYDKYQAAMAAAPESPLPLLAAAFALLDLSRRSSEPQAAKLHGMAAGMAREALRLAPGDALAQDALRQIEEGPPVVLHQPVPAAAQASDKAETLFVQHRFDEARKQYEAAMALDPLWSTPWVGAGDCYYGQKDWPRAEALFRHAVELEPRDGQAWRYLSDSLGQQGKFDAAEQAIYRAIATSPSERNNWGKLASLRNRRHAPLASLNLHRSSSVSVGADGKYTIHLDPHDSSTPDAAFALSLAMAEANARNGDVKHVKSSWDIELVAWQTAFRIADEIKANAGTGPADPALLRMQAMARDGQLDAALLILQYKPAYRAALDSWLAAHPDGVRTFIDRYSVQP
jgi:tetratricopeptide (TPR) repeat protein